MSAGPRIPIREAGVVADSVLERLGPACVRLEIAGSIRRRRPSVGDIELVAISKTRRDLFGDESDEVELLTLLDRSARSWGWVPVQRGSKSRRYDLGITTLDLFLSTPETWGVEFAIRTGPAAWSKALVTPRASGGRLDPGLRIAGGWRVMTDEGERVDVAEEQDFLALAGGWIEPQHRTNVNAWNAEVPS